MVGREVAAERPLARLPVQVGLDDRPVGKVDNIVNATIQHNIMPNWTHLIRSVSTLSRVIHREKPIVVFSSDEVLIWLFNH
jgi:hypothetical protein